MKEIIDKGIEERALKRETLDAIRELEEGRGKKFDTIEELFEELNEQD